MILAARNQQAERFVTFLNFGKIFVINIKVSVGAYFCLGMLVFYGIKRDLLNQKMPFVIFMI
jgi:hypothetical protein